MLRRGERPFAPTIPNGGSVEYKLLIDGKWTGNGPMLEVKNKYDDSLVGALPTATKEDLNQALDAAERA
jgi:acyl-CoA reductase-like NAD-dependent aldehyde dehydrogenase